MSESLVGLIVAATRQKAGKSLKLTGALSGPVGIGDTNAPAATDSATVIVVSGSFRDARRSQVCLANT
jgi:hypothetical protein